MAKKNIVLTLPPEDIEQAAELAARGYETRAAVLRRAVRLGLAAQAEHPAVAPVVVEQVGPSSDVGQ